MWIAGKQNGRVRRKEGASEGKVVCTNKVDDRYRDPELSSPTEKRKTLTYKNDGTDHSPGVRGTAGQARGGGVGSKVKNLSPTYFKLIPQQGTKKRKVC